MTFARNLHGIAVCALLAASAGALADSLPTIKPGLWDVSIAAAGQPARSIGKQCRDGNLDPSKMGAQKDDSKCSKPVIAVHGHTATADETCPMGSSTMHVQTVATFISDQAMHADVTTRFDPPMANMPGERKMGVDTHWLSACPADMKPGDFQPAYGGAMHGKPSP